MNAEAKTPTRCDKAQRRIEIAFAARALIAEKGFEGLRTRDIAERVGINIATLHYHVPSKDALIELLAESLRDEFVAQHQRQPRDGLSPLQRLRREFADFRDTLVDNPTLMLVMAELSDRARRDARIEQVIRPMQKSWADQIAAILAAGRDDGSFRSDLDPAAAAAMVIGAMVTTRIHDRRIEFYDRVTAELERAFLNPLSTSGDQAS
jgi:AcrR family transcriptional regulator